MAREVEMNLSDYVQLKPNSNAPLISAIVPVHNERETIKETLERLELLKRRIRIEVVVIDDGSTDGTVDIIKQFPSVTLLRHSKNLGKGASIKTGLANSKGEILIIQDADLEYPPEEIPKIVRPIIEKRADVVYGSRFLGKNNGMCTTHIFGNKVLSLAASLLYNIHITDLMTGHKAFSRDAIDSIGLVTKEFEIEAEITAKLLQKGWNFTEVPISYSYRKKGRSKIMCKHGFTTLLTLLKERFGR